MSELIFYTNPMSRGRIVRWMLEEVGCAYDARILPWGPAGSASAEYRAVNPMLKVPAIVHNGKTVTEAAAICLYLADAFPRKKLAPKLADRADYYRWILFAAGPVEQALTSQAMGWIVPDDVQKQGMLGFGTVSRTIDTLEEMLAGRQHVCGDAFTAADVYVGSHVIWGLQFGSLPQRPAFQSYAARLADREAYQRAREIDEALMAEAQQVGV